MALCLYKTIKESLRKTGTEKVNDFLGKLEHPLKKEIESIRQIILNARDGIEEHIKWNAPSFRYNNEDRITFNLRGKDTIMLVFHNGAKVRDNQADGPRYADTTGLLEWPASDRAIIKLGGMSDVLAKEERLVEIVNGWLDAADTAS